MTLPTLPTSTVAPIPELPSGVSAPAVLLLGEPGAGKTFALGTLAQRRKLIYLFTDPGGDESLLDALEHYNVPIDNVHWHYIPPAPSGWDTLNELAKKINVMDFQSITNLKSGINKQDHRQFFDILKQINDFQCQRTHKALGPVDKLDPNEYAFAFDSISGLNQIAKDTTVGAKPTLAQGEWNVAQNLLEMFLRQVISDVPLPRVFIGHVKASQDMMTGARFFTLALLGQALANSGVVVRQFSDVVFAYRSGKDFLWSTMEDRIALKTRNLPIDGKLKPNFGPIIDKWEARAKRARGGAST